MISEIEEYANLNNLYIYKFRENINEAIKQINKDGKNDICIILSKDESKVNKFKKEIDSTNIFVNEISYKIKHELPEGQFYLSENVAAMDLNFSRSKITRLIETFKELGIIEVVTIFPKNLRKASIYQYLITIS